MGGGGTTLDDDMIHHTMYLFSLASILAIGAGGFFPISMLVRLVARRRMRKKNIVNKKLQRGTHLR